MEIVTIIITFLSTRFTKICNPAEWGPGDAIAILNSIFAILGFICVIVFRKKNSPKKLKILEKSSVNQLFESNTIELSTKYYIEPDCTNMDPAQEEEPGDIFLSDPRKLFKAVDDYLSKNHRKYLLILADSGMGKTSFFLNYYVRNLNRLKRNQHLIEIIPLGLKNPDDRIKKINNKPETILFLDAFDEDILAIDDHRQRVRDLMDKCTDFKQVVITCRTQFFPKDEEIPSCTGIVRVGPRKAGVGGYYEFYKLYLAPLSDQQVSKYLRRYYPWQYKKRRHAFEIVKKIPNLKVRPMLLSCIPDIIEKDKNITNNAQLYEFMIQKWLERENRWVKEEDLLRFSEMLAVDIIVNKSKRGFERIPANELGELANQWQIKLENWQITGRSLLNRDADGNYKFSHRSILEYLFVCSFLKMPPDKRPVVDWTDLMKIFFRLKLNALKNDNLVKGKIINSIGIEFVPIPPGNFKMGTPDDDCAKRPDELLHNVTLSKGFLFATAPVTQSQWQKVMRKNLSDFKENGENTPVENVSWNKAKAFINKLNKIEQTNTYCLPTEAQWEYACRAGTTTMYCFGDDEEILDEYAWYDQNSKGMTHPVKQKKANAWGLYDMHGNVWEWCEDWYGNYPNETVIDPTGPNKGACRVIRGGSWYDSPSTSRSADRDEGEPGKRYNYLGFRLIRKINS